MDPGMHGITVNGNPLGIPAGGSLRDVLRVFGLDPDHARGVAVALNDEVVRRESWAETTVRAGDRVEIVTAQQGG